MLQRKTPLKRSGSLKRSPLRKVSKKYGKALRIYSDKRKDFLERHPACFVGIALTQRGYYKEAANCTLYSTQVHHVCRRGKFLNEESTWLPICHTCHSWLETHASTARAMGLLK